MKIAMITWEYPPIMVGGLSVHCKGLAEALVKIGHDVDIITVGYELPEYENINGVNIHRVRPIKHGHFLTWTLLMENALEKKLGLLGIDNYDVIHCHDWMTYSVGSNIKHLLNKPYIQSIHSTEMGRCGGIHSEDSKVINDLEWWSTYESHALITVSNSTKEEICSIFNVPWDKVNVIYNGINPEEFDIPMDDQEKNNFKLSIGIQPHEKMILFVGRLVYQKGVEYLIRAVPDIIKNHPNSKVVIAGSGDMRGYLEDLAFQLGCRDKIIFLGFISGQMLKKLYKSSDLTVIPSIYEPFGIVALEAMASGSPVIASAVGGLKEIIHHEYNGVTVYPNNPDSIAWGVNRVLSDERFREWIVNNAKKDVYNKYSWEAVAHNTIDVYSKVIKNIK
ncbi:glycosyltransferase family 4 protein [Methanothermococcus sp. SCGC AD-155-M21]|nr:glycosyltransferase family 4 protein [Methanothermococcus sp. SCGC AD-155-M21]